LDQLKPEDPDSPWNIVWSGVVDLGGDFQRQLYLQPT
jgi:hypothetical protein